MKSSSKKPPRRLHDSEGEAELAVANVNPLLTCYKYFGVGELKRSCPMARRLNTLKLLAEGALDCVVESQNEVVWGEWGSAETNLRKLFRNAAAIQRQRGNVLRWIRLARKEAK
jgi:hypothetical protein